MIPNNAYNQYKENSVFTASPEELTLMLYNGLIKFLMLAQKAIDEKESQKAHESIVRAEDIVQEFMASLNMKYDVSRNMMLMYDYMYRRLIEANTKKDKEILEEVLGFAKEFRDIWAQAMKVARQQQPRQAVSE
jgi:flagellar secretion chaperone FliS